MFEEINNKISKFESIKNHKRLKTNIDETKLNHNTQNQIIMKSSIKRFKSNQIDQNQIPNLIQAPFTIRYSQGQNIKNKKIFKIKINRQNTQPQNTTIHPLKQYLNDLNNQLKFKSLKKFTNINNENQVQFNKQIHMAQINQQKQINAMNIKKQININHKIIEQTFKKLSRFKEAGYTQKKINQWILRYCLHKRKYMLKLLMKPVSKNKFSNQVDYTYERDINMVKQKILKVRKRVNGKDLLIDHYDLLQFSEYLQNILIKKNTVKVFELRQSIIQKLDQCFIYNRQKNQKQFRKRLEQGQKYNFVSDLNQIEQKTGKFYNISSFNRQYYIQLGKTQRQIRKKIYDLINVTENLKIKAAKKQSQTTDDWLNE